MKKTATLLLGLMALTACASPYPKVGYEEKVARETTAPRQMSGRIAEPYKPGEEHDRRMGGDLMFASNSSTLSPSVRRTLDGWAEYMKNRSHVSLLLTGHSDIRGGEDANAELAGRRANEVKEYLIEQGVDPWRVSVREFGETRPKVQGNSQTAHAANRRVTGEFTFPRGTGIPNY